MGNGVTTIIIVLLLAMCGWVFILWKNSQKMHDTIKNISLQQNLVRHDHRARMLCNAVRILNPDVSPGIDYIIKNDAPGQDAYIAQWMNSAPRPTEEDIKAAMLEVADTDHELEYATMRQAEYPSVGEQLDAAYLARQGDNTKQREIDDRIRRIKEKYPKADDSCV